MKSIIIAFFVVFFFLSCFLFSLFCFALWNINPSEWPAEARGFFAALEALVFLMTIMIASDPPENYLN